MGERKQSTNDRNRKAYNFCQIKSVSEVRQKFKDHRTGNAILTGTISEFHSDSMEWISWNARSSNTESNINYVGGNCSVSWNHAPKIP